MTAFVLALALFAVGCAGSQQQVSDTGTAWPLDSLAFLYSDPVANAPINDHPLRIVGFAMHPAGVIIDYVVNRPAYVLASTHPILFGYTPEDSTLHAQRPRGYGALR
jgi:hypothetical protein